MKKLITLGLLMIISMVHAETSQMVTQLQTRWAEVKYELPVKAQEKSFAELAAQADAAALAEPANADVLIWQGIIHASFAGAKGGLGALGEVKKAKKIFEKAIEIQPEALNGSAYTSLGSLYYQVPGWPVGFGDSKKAAENLQKGLALNPDGIDSNFFQGDYLMSEGEYTLALAAFEKALKAPPRPDRKLADDGRKREILAAIEKIREKQK